VLSANTSLALPNQTVKAILRLGGSVVAEKDVLVAPKDATVVSATVPSSQAAGAVFEAEIRQGDQSLLVGKTTLP